jgi:hypothetical protein
MESLIEDSTNRLPHLLTPAEFAAFVGVSERTTARWREAGSGPRFVKLGHRIFYTRDAVIENVKSATYQSTAEAKQARKA